MDAVRECCGRVKAMCVIIVWTIVKGSFLLSVLVESEEKRKSEDLFFILH